jgi:nicotinamidase-related amidase
MSEMSMSAKLLLIDPQNDFCDVDGAALPVAGASADMRRLARFIDAFSPHITHLSVTLDSHPRIAIERVTFWRTGAGHPIAPFTPILESDVRAGRFVPRELSVLPQVLDYLAALERAGKYTLMVWPVHCVIGTWGHNLHTDIDRAVRGWELARGKNSLKVLKGIHPLTEQYSAVRAEVELPDAPGTGTNRGLIEAARPTDGLLLVGGEALSHCVAATVDDLLAEFSPAERTRVILLSDCMSPVAGFDHSYFERAQQRGVRAMSGADVLAGFGTLN